MQITPALKLVAGSMLAMAAVFGFGRFVYTPVLPHMIAAGLTASAAGVIAAGNFLGYLAGALAGVTGLMQRRARLWFVGSTAVNGLTMIAMAFTNDITLFVLLRFVGGAAGAIVMVSGATVMFGPLTAVGRGWYGMSPFIGVGVGIAASSLAVSLLAWGGATWQQMWIVTGLIASAMTLGVVLLVPRSPAGTLARNVVGSGRIKWSRRLILLTLSYGLFGFGYVITATFIVVITRETPALSALEPYIWAIVGLGGAASIPFWSAVSRRIGDVPTYVVGCLVEAVGVALSVVNPGPAAIVVSAIFLGGTFMAITGVGLQIGRRLAAEAPQRIQALMTAAFGIGQVIGPLVAGHLRETSGSFFAASLAAAAALVIGAILAAVP